MQIQKHFRLLLLVVSGLVIVTIAWAGSRGWKKRMDAPKNAEHVDKDKYDPVQAAILDDLSGLLARFDSSHHSYLLEGKLTVVDRNDSAGAMNNTPYKFFKVGKSFYYLLGQTETICNDHVFLYVQNDAKKMLTTSPKIIVEGGGFPFNDLYKLIKGEGFNISKSREGNYSLISLKNETHLSCKELTVEYDSTTKDIHKIFMRLPDVTDNLNVNKETWVSLVITKWQLNPDPHGLVTDIKFIKKDEMGNWITVPDYANYEIISN